MEKLEHRERIYVCEFPDGVVCLWGVGLGGE